MRNCALDNADIVREAICRLTDTQGFRVKPELAPCVSPGRSGFLFLETRADTVSGRLMVLDDMAEAGMLGPTGDEKAPRARNFLPAHDKPQVIQTPGPPGCRLLSFPPGPDPDRRSRQDEKDEQNSGAEPVGVIVH
jgi:hypothetical protein